MCVSECMCVFEPQLHADFFGELKLKCNRFLAGFQKLQVMDNGIVFS